MRRQSRHETQALRSCARNSLCLAQLVNGGVLKISIGPKAQRSPRSGQAAANTDAAQIKAGSHQQPEVFQCFCYTNTDLHCRAPPKRPVSEIIYASGRSGPRLITQGRDSEASRTIARDIIYQDASSAPRHLLPRFHQFLA